MMKELLILLIFSLGIYCFLIEPNKIKKEEIVIPLEDVSCDLKNSTFVQISDIHFKRNSSKIKKLLKILDEIHPDYLFITGDLIDRKTDNLEEFRVFVSELRNKSKNLPIMVLGNHEYKNPKMKEFLKIVEENGIKVLRNEKVILENNIVLVGIDDPHTHHDDVSRVLPLSKTSPKIILAHSPEIFRKLDLENALVLCGHTHGGQIDIPPLTKIILPLAYDKQYKKGLFRKDKLFMYVNRGIGETFLPIRFNSFPEITIIKLGSKD